MTYEAKIFAGKICKTTAHPRPFPQLFYFPGITSKPWHDPKEFSFTKYIQSHAQEIKKEYLKHQDQIEKESQSAEDVDPFHRVKEGVCYKYPLVKRGQLVTDFKKLMPKTFHVFDELRKLGEAPMLDVPFSSSYLSIMKPVTSLDKHYGPCNIRLRCHLPIILPESSEACFIRCGGEIKFWKEGEL